MKAPSHHEKAYHHCVSRIVNRDYVLKEQEKEHFVKLMRMYEKLYGVRVVTFCIMCNHFHILLEVPNNAQKRFSDQELISLVHESLGEEQGNKLEWIFNHYHKQGNTNALEALRDNWHSRMWNVSSYMKVLKQCFTQWFNRKHNRTGTLWEGRFKSTLVQAEGRALKTMAAYIDLNPARAKMHDDPKDYRWSGYGEAVAGNQQAQAALHFLTTVSNAGGLKPEEYCPSTTQESLAMWRRILFGAPENPNHLEEWQKLQLKAVKRHKKMKTGKNPDIVGSVRRRVPREKALEVLEKGGKLTRTELLACKVRYFCDGTAIGTKSFVEEVFQANREKFGESRKDGARKLKGIVNEGAKEEAFHTLRDLRKSVFT